MRIAIDTLFEHPDRPSSAVDYLKNLAKYLPRAGPEHSYYLFVSRRNARHFRDLQNLNIRLVNCLASNEHVALRILVQQSLLPIQMHRRRFDVLFSPGNVCPLLGDFCRILKINTLHHYHTPKLIGRTRSAYRRVAFLKSAEKADRVIANTSATKKEIHQFLGVPESKISIVAEASYDFYRPLSDDQTRGVRERYGLNRSYILFASTLYPYKNAETLIRAFAKLTAPEPGDLELVIAGRDCDSQQVKLEAIAWGLGVRREVRFLGFVPPEDLAFLYSGARVFVYPSLAETFGKPLVEAMCCGVPIVASNTTCIPEVVGDAGILVNPLDVEQMANAIQEAAVNNKLRTSLIICGLERARQFSWGTSARETLRVIEEAANERYRQRTVCALSDAR